MCGCAVIVTSVLIVKGLQQLVIHLLSVLFSPSSVVDCFLE